MGRAFEYRRAAKEKRWDKMSKVFPKLAKVITVAAKQGGSDPEMNSKLRTAILNAKAQNMPKDNIEAAIKRASGKDEQDIKEIHYEGKSPHGALIFVECATDNPVRTVANVKAHFGKCGGQILQNGSLEFMFSRKAVFEFEKPANLTKDDLELALIDGGLEELDENEGIFYAYAPYSDFGSLSSALESLGIEPKKAALEYIPNTPVEFSEEQLADIEKLIDRLEDDDDVQAVYTNIA
ncbi:MAG: YebC/PmpR family DNA-binding transcriptional regulator [Campylobacteraceae bacterium]|jgi:YebC/PmpR family DNA-binding regulatory protein|nr:YebC/PmpR family DNA-binding transcriptional regulator [Campylobacteraceae bacterium]